MSSMDAVSGSSLLLASIYGQFKWVLKVADGQVVHSAEVKTMHAALLDADAVKE